MSKEGKKIIVIRRPGAKPVAPANKPAKELAAPKSTLPKGWQCVACHRVMSPWRDSCDCQVVQILPQWGVLPSPPMQPQIEHNPDLTDPNHPFWQAFQQGQPINIGPICGTVVGVQQVHDSVTIEYQPSQPEPVPGWSEQL